MINSGRSNFLAFLSLLTFAFALTCFLTFPDTAFSVGYSSAKSYYANVFHLTGEIDLVYENQWSTSPGADRQKYNSSLRLGLDGFIIDRRLISFDLTSSFSKDMSYPGDTIDGRSYAVRLGLLNEKPRGFLGNFPQPIDLKYSNFMMGDAREQTYGVSFIYKPTENPLFSGFIKEREKEKRMKMLIRESKKKKKEEDEEDESEEEEPDQKKKADGASAGEQSPAAKPSETRNSISFPTFIFDYDNYKYELVNSVKTDSDRYDMRATSWSKNVDLQAEYSYNKFNGLVDKKYQTLDLNAYHHYYDDKAYTRLDAQSSAELTDDNSLRSLDLSNLTTWQKRLGKDRIQLQGKGDYFKSDFRENYDIGATGGYRKVLSEKLWDEVTLHFDQGRTEIRSIHDASAGNNLNYLLSKIFTVTNDVLVGQTELGSHFAAALGLEANIRPVTVWTKYDFSSTALDEGRTNSHRFEMSVKGRLSRKLNFSSRNVYHISEVDGRQPYKEHGYDLRGDLFWNISMFSINVGASDVEKHKSAFESAGVAGTGISDPVDVWTRALYSNVSVFLSRSMFLTLSSTYTKDSSGLSSTFVSSILSWNVRRVILTAEYDMTTLSGLLSKTNHRVFIRLSRSFDRMLRNVR